MEINTLLLVDDLPENLYSLENVLAGPDRQFLKATSGNEALKIALRDEPSLILLDVQMPEMDGFEVAEILKSNPRTSQIPIIFVTAINKDSKYVVKGLQDGAIDYLFKPIDVEITRAKVSTILKMVQQQKELEQKNEELTRLNFEKNQLLGMASHDLRSPLGNIMMLSNLILDGTHQNLTEDQLDFLSMIKKSSSFMMELINNILDVSKIESGKLDLIPLPADMGKIIATNMGLNKLAAANKNIDLIVEIPDKPIIAEVDNSYIDQVLNNLVSNAIKFSRSGTRITVRMEKEGDFCKVSVNDQGQGIPEKEMNKLFKFFSRTSVQSTQGEISTGLGLAICRKIVEGHGGRITVESSEGEGSTFSFTLPLGK